jgi:hypothetical protein
MPRPTPLIVAALLLLTGCTLGDTAIRRGTPITHIQADFGHPDAISDRSGSDDVTYLPHNRPAYEWPADSPRTFYYLDRDLQVTFIHGKATDASAIAPWGRDRILDLLERQPTR